MNGNRLKAGLRTRRFEFVVPPSGGFLMGYPVKMPPIVLARRAELWFLDPVNIPCSRPMGTSSKELERKLRKVAARQHGCFTAAQAIEAGYADSVHLYHVKNGSWIRVSRGVYRHSDALETPAARCLAALLWTRGKTGKIQGILAAETARQLASGSLPPKEPIRLLVPKGFRRSSNVPDGIHVSIVEIDLHITSKIDGIPSEQIDVIDSAAEDYIKDKPDYYDWIDYQDSLCAN